jgi:hypothetical protein
VPACDFGDELIHAYKNGTAAWTSKYAAPSGSTVQLTMELVVVSKLIIIWELYMIENIKFLMKIYGTLLLKASS